MIDTDIKIEVTADDAAVTAYDEAMGAYDTMRKAALSKRPSEGVCTIRQVADVVQLDDHRLVPDPYVVDACRKLLAMAESGELQALQWAGALSKGRTRVATVGQWSDVIQMLGATAMLKLHVEAIAMEGIEEI